jgi:multidrug efflux system outer membrane protein
MPFLRCIHAVETCFLAEQRRYDLSTARYRNGVDSYLTVLSAQQDLYNARQNLVILQFSWLANLVSLYQALGGGWQENTVPGFQDGSGE